MRKRARRQRHSHDSDLDLQVLTAEDQVEADCWTLQQGVIQLSRSAAEHEADQTAEDRYGSISHHHRMLDETGISTQHFHLA